MTDEYPRDPAQPPSEPPAPPPMAEEVEEHHPETVLAGAGEFTSGEGLVAFAGLVLVATWLVFTILATEYFVYWTGLIMAVAAAVTPRVNRMTVEQIAPVSVIMKVLGYGIAVTGVFALLEDIRFEVYDEIWAVIAALLVYAASVMAFIGARQIKT